jgi:hypothetical protein
VKFSANSYEEMQAIFLAKRLIEDKYVKAGKENEIEMHRDVSECFEKGKEHKEVELLVAELNSYSKSLKHLGIQDWQVTIELNLRSVIFTYLA